MIGTRARAQLRLVRSHITEGHQTVVTLDCGHIQLRNRTHAMDLPKQVLCFDCGEASR